MSRGIALALSAITGMCAVLACSARIRSAWRPLMPGRLMSIRMTSGRVARAISTPRIPSLALSNAMSGPTRDQVLDQHQIGRVVFDIEQRVQRVRSERDPEPRRH